MEQSLRDQAPPAQSAAQHTTYDDEAPGGGWSLHDHLDGIISNPADPTHLDLWRHHVEDLGSQDHVEAEEHHGQQQPTAEKPPQPAMDREPTIARDDCVTPERSKRVREVERGFLWLNDAAQQRIETLRRDLEQSEKPSWIGYLVEAALDIGLVAGAAAGGEYVGGLLLARRAEHDAAVGVEFVKTMFEEGTAKGLEAAKAGLGKRNSHEDVNSFLDAQKEGVRAMHFENQRHFVDTTSTEIGEADLNALAATFDPVNLPPAADMQRGASRDAWVSYLAQATFGAYGEAPVRTNMTTEESRERTNKWAPGFVPEEAPSLIGAIAGRVPGVLEVAATLPDIAGNVMVGDPKVTLAILDGVNETVRRDYADKPLASAHVPRQIVAHVIGDMPDFTLNLDEDGDLCHPLKHAEAAWLRARAAVGRGASGQDDFQQQRTGLGLLLGDLRPDEVKGGIL